MKQIETYIFLIFLGITLIAPPLQAQNLKDQLKDVEQAVAKEDYQTALTMLNQVNSQIRELYANQLATTIFPEKIGDYEPVSTNNTGNAGGNGIRVVRTYREQGAHPHASNGNTDQPETEDPGIEETAAAEESSGTLMVSVTNATDLVGEIAQAHINGPQNSREGVYRPVNVGEYRGLLVYDSASGFGSLSIIVGAATIQIDAQGIPSTEILMEIADDIDFDQVLATFGY